MPDSVAAGPADVTESGPESSGPGLHRVADLEIFPAGDGLSLAYARDSGAAAFYRADVLGLLASCREFRTIDQHVREYQAVTGSGLEVSALRRELVRLSRAGFLVSPDGLCPGAGGGPALLSPLSTIVIPTRDRVPLLRRAISGYAENCARHGRRADFVVADDSAGLGTRRDCLAMLGQLSRHLDIDIFYAGTKEKSAFISRLASAGGIPGEVVRFACLPGRGSGVTVGANRNALLLDTAGERILSVDDDTVCKVAVPPGRAEGIDLHSGGNPLELWFFQDREEALTAVRYAEEDVLGRHGHYLGAAPAPALAAAGPESFRHCDPALLRRVRAADSRIRVTANGVTGDCGWDNPDFHLFQDGATFARLVSSPDGFRVARVTREMVQAVTRTTITAGGDPKFAMCMGLDNTDLLPPFLPAGRAEEVAFGAILTACFSHVYAAHLPMLVQHDPAARKRFPAEGMFTISPGSWLQSCIAQFDAGLAASPATRLPRLGHFLTDLGQLPDRAFDEFARLIAWTSMGGLIGSLEDRLAGPEPVPAYWAREARQFIARARRNALAPAEEWYASVGGREALKQLLQQFGQVLIWWPAIAGAARELRAAGDRLALPLRDASCPA
jgi:hypothetical protein